MSTKHIKAVFFDWAGVMVNSSVERFHHLVEKEFGVSDIQIVHDAVASKGGLLFAQMELGLLDEKVFWEEFAKHLNRPLPASWATIIDRALANCKFRPRMKQLNASLQQKGIKTAVLSNTSAPFARRHYRLGQYALFPYKILSHEVGMRKPDEKIYYYALDMVGVKPQEAIFIDDNVQNIAAAQKIGLHTIHFVNQKDFFKTLTSFGL